MKFLVLAKIALLANMCMEGLCGKTNQAFTKPGVAKLDFSSGRGLRLAYNVAFRLVCAEGTLNKLIKQWHRTYQPVLYCLPTYDVADIWPKVQDYPDDALQSVLVERIVRVGGYPNNWGDAGDYTKDTPFGFYPDLLRACVQKISEKYCKTGPALKVVWTDCGDNCINSLPTRQFHMTDVFVLIPLLTASPLYTSGRIDHGCATILTTKFIYHRKTDYLDPSNPVMSLNQLIDAAWEEEKQNTAQGIKTVTVGDRQENPKRRIRFVTEGSGDIWVPFLSRHAIGVARKNDGDLHAHLTEIAKGEIVATFRSGYENIPADIADKITKIPTGFQIPLAAAFLESMKGYPTARKSS